MLESAFAALATMLTPETALYFLLGVVGGLVVGILPGIGGPSAIAMLLPFTLYMDTEPALAMIIGLAAAGSGIDSVPAILFGIPGSVSSQATVLDGQPLARMGQAGRALGAAYMSSLLGGLFAALILTALIPVARPIVLTFGSPELLMLAVLGVVMTASVSGSSVAKGLLAGCVGFMLSMIGLEHASGTPRWTFGSLYLYDGLPLVIVALGLFALPEVIDLKIKGTKISDQDVLVRGGVLQGIRDAFRHWFLVLRTSVLGTVLGMIPGLGGSVVDWFAYGHARNTEKGARETFGKGDIRGVIGVDAAQNAQVGGALVPTLFLGVPGNVTMSMLLVVFVIQGLQPGPEMVTTHLDLTMVMIWSLVFANVLAAGFCLAFSAQFAKIALVPAHIVAPLVVVIMAFAAVNASRNVGDLVALLAIGTLGWIMKRLHWPRPPLLIAFVLGPIIEQYLFISTNRYGMGWLLHPGVIAIGMCMALVFVFEVRNARRARAERAVPA